MNRSSLKLIWCGAEVKDYFVVQVPRVVYILWAKSFCSGNVRAAVILLLKPSEGVITLGLQSLFWWFMFTVFCCVLSPSCVIFLWLCASVWSGLMVSGLECLTAGDKLLHSQFQWDSFTGRTDSYKDSRETKDRASVTMASDFELWPNIQLGMSSIKILLRGGGGVVGRVSRLGGIVFWG